LKKLLVFLIAIAAAAIIFFNIVSMDEASMSSDGLQTNITYLDGSTELMKDASIEGSLLKKNKIQFKTQFQKDNSIEVSKSTSSDLQLIITDTQGTELLSKKIDGTEEYTFSATTETGIVEILLESGDHNFSLSMNEGN
jgi:hypothetical protein